MQYLMKECYSVYAVRGHPLMTSLMNSPLELNLKVMRCCCFRSNAGLNLEQKSLTKVQDNV